jgi:hypothetical protein
MGLTGSGMATLIEMVYHGLISVPSKAKRCY